MEGNLFNLLAVDFVIKIFIHPKFRIKIYHCLQHTSAVNIDTPSGAVMAMAVAFSDDILMSTYIHPPHSALLILGSLIAELP